MVSDIYPQGCSQNNVQFDALNDVHNNSDFHDFHLRELPNLLMLDSGLKAVAASRELWSLCIRLTGSDDVYSYCPKAHSIEIVAGTEGDITAYIDSSQWDEFIKNPIFPRESVSFKYDYQCEEDLERWERVLRLLFQSTENTLLVKGK